MSESNDEQIKYWNGSAGNTWTQSQERMDLMLQPLTQVALEAAQAGSDDYIIDIGCGCGDTSLQLAEVAAQVRGIDISEPMLQRARERATALGLSNISFETADAAITPLTAEHQLLFSRFGIMFFADPTAAFKNLRGGLTPGGRLCFICWRPPRQNPWMSVGGAAIAPFLPEPETPLDPRAPGPFAFADKDYLAGVLTAAGFKAIDIAPVDRTLKLADTLDDAMRFQGEIGPVARALSELEGTQKERALAAARTALAEHLTTDGINLGAAIWLVTARV